MASMTYQQLKTNITCVQSIETFSMVQKINEHVTMKMTAVIGESYQDSYVKDVSSQEQIKVYAEKELLFEGLIDQVEVYHEGNFYYMKLKGISNSYSLDTKLKKRSFQNKSMTYHALIKQILKDYKSGDLIDSASNGAAIQTVQLQYEETDWAFIKRLASDFDQGIVPNAFLNGPKIFFGIPQGKSIGKVEDFQYRVSKNLRKYNKASANSKKQTKEVDSVRIHMTADQNFNIGDNATYQGAALFIRKKEIEMKQGILTFFYELSSKNGLSKRKIHNTKMTGISIKGKVMERLRDKVKVHLEIDESQDKGTAWEFPYATMYASEGNSGWYCMPEEGDTVLIYFPDTHAGNAVGTGSIRVQGSSGDKIDNPNIKYFRTADGKEIMFSPSEIVITCGNGADNVATITLNTEDGITMICSEPIKLQSEKNITLEAEEKIEMTAEEQIKLQCKSSEITMDSMIDICGPEVKIN